MSRLRALPFCAPGGGSGIRTHEGFDALTVFKTAAFVHSAIPPNLLARGYYNAAGVFAPNSATGSGDFGIVSSSSSMSLSR